MATGRRSAPVPDAGAAYREEAEAEADTAGLLGPEAAFDSIADEGTDPGTACSRYPKGVFFIFGNEFSERFAYYGMRAILVLYFTHYLEWSSDRATVFYHVFVMLSYLTSIGGGILADSGLGKRRTILYLSIVYCIGNVVMSVTSIRGTTGGDPPSPWGALLGLLLLAIGAGGIKPCVAAFGGDQFGAGQLDLVQGYFAVFYFSINAGSLMSMIITPKLRADVHCFGDSECFPLAFGVPAALMFAALIIFVLGTSFYREVIAERNVVLDAFRAYKIGIVHKFRAWRDGREPSNYWLDPASKPYGNQFVADLKAFHRILIIFAPAPIFWALYDQQGSRWTLQAEEMKMFNMGALGRFRPDQMQAINSILVLTMIPIFEKFIYPTLHKLRLPVSPLKRMGAGMLLCGLAFVISGLVQQKIDNNIVVPEALPNMSKMRIVNTFASNSAFVAREGPGGFNATVAALHRTEFENVAPGANNTLRLLTLGIGGRAANVTESFPVDTVQSLYVVDLGAVAGVGLVTATSEFRKERTEKANKARVQFVSAHAGIGTVSIVTNDDEDEEFDLTLPEFSASAYIDGQLEGGSKDIIVTNASGVEILRQYVQLDDGAFYTFVLYGSEGAPLRGWFVQDVVGNQVSVLWQLPQYVVITCSEILFSVTGQEFAYSQAPSTMKAVAQSVWLITTALGSLVVIIVAESAFLDQANEFFFFAGLMGVVMILFVFLASRYVYFDPNASSSARSSARGTPVDSASEDAITDSAPLLRGTTVDSSEV